MSLGDNACLYGTRNKIGLVLGPLLFAAVLLLDLDPRNPAVTRMAASAVWIATWWITEAIPIPATSLMPVVLFPALGIQTAKEASPSYANSMIFLFMGGFIIALAIERWNLHRRIALTIIEKIGGRERRLVLGFMIATAALSMWISNTATAMMMLPIGLAVISHLEAEGRASEPAYAVERPMTGDAEIGRSDSVASRGSFGLALMLGIAYGASIGGIGTLIGTPPNIVLKGFVRQQFPQCDVISFTSWLMIGVPFAAVFLIVAWVLLTYVICRVREGGDAGGALLVREQRKLLGPMSKPERRVLAVFLATAALWVFRADIELGPVVVPGWSGALGLGKSVDDSTVAIFMALVLFVIPSGRQRFEPLMDWRTAVRIPWGILLLFGGGLALAGGMESSGLSQWLGERFQLLGGAPYWALIVAVSLLITFLTEITSNTATVSMILPVLASVSRALGINPLLLMVPATISGSCAFMLPVATPPNAIVFGSGRVTISAMARAGLVLNFVGVILVFLAVTLLGRMAFGIEPGVLPAWTR